MHRLRAILKRCIAYALYSSGALWLYRRAILGNGAVVLMYHRVLPPTADTFSSPGIVVSPGVFTANMEFLRKHFTPLSAGQFQACLDRRHFPRGACLVTFDDGWEDNANFALPILQRLDVPAVLFVATGYVGTDHTFWQELMTRQLYMLSRDPVVGRSTLAKIGLAEAFHADDLEHSRHLVRNYIDQLKLSTTEEIERISGLVAAAWSQIGCADKGLGEDRFLDWHGVQLMAASGLVTIGSHAHSHVPLPRLGREGILADLRRSVREIERQELPPPSLLAFPNGDYDAATLDCLSAAGLKTGFTTEKGYVRAGIDVRRIPRVNIHNAAASTPAEFLCRILGIF